MNSSDEDHAWVRIALDVFTTAVCIDHFNLISPPLHAIIFVSTSFFCSYTNNELFQTNSVDASATLSYEEFLVNGFLFSFSYFKGKEFYFFYSHCLCTVFMMTVFLNGT